MTNKTRKMVLQVTKTLSMVDDLIFMCTLPLEQSVFTGTFGNPVCAENQNNCNDALEDTGCSTQRIIVLADAPGQGVDINGFRNTLDQAVAKQILDFKACIQYVANIHDQKNHNGGLDARKRDVPDFAPPAGTIQSGCLIQAGIDGGNGGQVDNGIPAGFLPNIGKCNDWPKNNPDWRRS